MLASIIWIVALIVLITCVVIQRRALNRIAFGRSIFISGMSFLVSFLVTLAPPGPEIWVLFVFFQILAWVFLLFMTIRSLQRLRAGLNRKS